MTKHFYKPMVHSMKKEFEEVNALGPASVEEWTKGLASRRQQYLDEIVRWEKWESRGGLKKVNSRQSSKQGTSGPMPNWKKGITPNDESSGPVFHAKRGIISDEGSRSHSSTPKSASAVVKKEFNAASPCPNQSIDTTPLASNTEMCRSNLDPHLMTDSLALQKANLMTYFIGNTVRTSRSSVIPSQADHRGMQSSIHQPRPERNIRDINDAKAARRAEIERRCSLLDPPLLPSILNHMESFQAAIQITQPMTDQAWQILRPRLLAQLPYAKRKEKERTEQEEMLAEESRQRREQEAQLKETKENLDREWETFQNPVRNLLGALADDIIEARWAGGRNLTRETSPKFAADILVGARQRFYAQIAHEDEAAVTAGEPIRADPSNGPPTRTLILENMKWLFDTKIKPLTDHLQREIFLCNGCDGNFKFYGFEGVVQHYAAKHTTTLSMGNIVVHWRAEWPEHPPFSPDPSVAKTTHNHPTSAHIKQNSSASESQGPGYYGTRMQHEELANYVPARQDNPYLGINGHSTIPNVPVVESKSDTVAGKSYPSLAGANLTGDINGYTSSSSAYNSYLTGQQGPAPGSYGAPFGNAQPVPASVQVYAAAGPGQIQVNGAAHYRGTPHLPYQYPVQTGPQVMHVPNPIGPSTDLYQRQMNEMAKHAKDIFTSIGGVKDLPGSVRLFVVIQLTVSRFKTAFPNEPSLSMFIDGLDHNPTMRPVRSVNGLGCKTCMDSGTGAKLFTLPHLVNHFRTVHVESTQMTNGPLFPEMDWKHDMIDLPDASVISRLAHAAGMTAPKISLIASVFPEIFASPLPPTGVRVNAGQQPLPRRELDPNLTAPISMPKQTATEAVRFSNNSSRDPNYHQHHSAFRPVFQDPPSEPLEPPGEDEYDPHRPAYLGKMVSFESKYRDDRRIVRPTMISDDRTASFHPPPEPIPRKSQQLDGNSHAIAWRTPQRPLESNSSGAYRHGKPPSMRESPVSDYGFPPEGRYLRHAEDSDVSPERRYVIANNVSQTTSYRQHYRSFPEPDPNDTSSTFVGRENRRLSSPRDVDAATKFLSTLAPALDAHQARELSHPGQETDRRLHESWQSEPQTKRRKKDDGEEDLYDQRPGDMLIINHQENGFAVDPGHAVSPISPNGGGIHFPQRAGSRADFYGDSGHPRHFHMPPRSPRSDGSPNAFADTQQMGGRARQETNGSVTQRPRSGSHSLKKPRLASPGSVSVSPQPDTATMGLYRPRSPVEEDRGNAVYRSPPPYHRQGRQSRHVVYEHTPQSYYEHIDDRGIQEQEPRYWKYVPVDYEDSRFQEPAPRYITSRLPERVPPEYIRYNHTFPVQPLYEEEAQSHRIYQRAYQDQSNPALTPSAHRYRY